MVEFQKFDKKVYAIVRVRRVWREKYEYCTNTVDGLQKYYIITNEICVNSDVCLFLAQIFYFFFVFQKLLIFESFKIKFKTCSKRILSLYKDTFSYTSISRLVMLLKRSTFELQKLILEIFHSTRVHTTNHSRSQISIELKQPLHAYISNIIRQRTQNGTYTFFKTPFKLPHVKMVKMLIELFFPDFSSRYRDNPTTCDSFGVRSVTIILYYTL